MEIVAIFMMFMIFIGFGTFIVLIFINEKERRKLEKEKINLIKRLEELEVSFNQRLKYELELYKKEDRKYVEEKVRKNLEKEYKALLEEWKKEEEKALIEKITKDFGAYTLKKLGELIAPLYSFYQYGMNPKDFRFIGCPVDYIVFKGLEDGDYNNLEICLISVKTKKGKNYFNEKEIAIKKAIEENRVKWIDIEMDRFINENLNMDEFKKLELNNLEK